MGHPTLLIDVTATSSGQSGVGRWISGFCKYLDSRGIEFQTASAASWANSTRGILGALVRVRVVRDFLYYAIGLPEISARYQRVVIIDNIGRLMSPLPPAACPFYLIHDLIPLEMSGRFIANRLGWSAALTWPFTRRLYRWRLGRVLFAPGARFGYISKATEQSAFAAFGQSSQRGTCIGPMMVRVGAADTSSRLDGEVATLASVQKYVLALGTGDPKKGLESLLRAWRLAGVSGRLRLVLFGASWKGKGRKWVDATIRDLGIENAVHVGPVSDATLQVLYRNAAAFVFPSHFEGLGLPPAEFCLEGHGELILRDIPALREIYGDVAHFFSSDRELTALLRAVAEGGVISLMSPASRREKLRTRLDSSATFERLCRAILSQGCS